MNPLISNTLSSLNDAAHGRKIWIWGVGNQGRGMFKILSANSVEIAGFIDSATHHHGRTLMGVSVCAPDIITNREFIENNFVVIAAFFFEKEIAALCLAAGLLQDKDFLFYSQLKPNDYSIDVSGTCNLKCIACPRSIPEERKLGFMTLEAFQKILDKIVEESPFVGNIQLYQWGEPVLNPKLPEMIAYAHSKGIRCAISSNLNARVDYARIIEAKPEWLRISASGWEEDYEITHTKGRWPIFMEHLHKVAQLRREHHPEMKVELYYHLYKHSVGDGLEKFKALSSELGIELHPVYAYLISLDDVLGYCEGKPLSPQAQQASELLLLDLDRGIEIARQYAHLDCDALRCININWDGSVSNCMMYYYPEANVVAANYLEISLEDIQARRYASDLCRRCMAHGLHQYCSSYARLDTGVPAHA